MSSLILNHKCTRMPEIPCTHISLSRSLAGRQAALFSNQPSSTMQSTWDLEINQLTSAVDKAAYIRLPLGLIRFHNNNII